MDSITSKTLFSFTPLDFETGALASDRPVDPSKPPFLALQSLLSNFILRKGLPTPTDLGSLFEAYLQFLSDRSCWDHPSSQTSGVQKIYFISETPEFKEFHEEVKKSAGRFEHLIPKIHHLILEFSTYLTTTKETFFYGKSNRNEDLLFFCFTPLLVAYPMEPILGETILNLLGDGGFFSTCINYSLLKKCFDLCPGHPQVGKILYQKLCSSFSIPTRNYLDNCVNRIHPDFFLLFLNSNPPLFKLTELFFRLFTHSLITPLPEEKEKCHVLIHSFIEKYPQLLNSYRPKCHSVAGEQSLKKLCILALTLNAPDLKNELLSWTTYGYSTNLSPTDQDKFFFQRLLIRIDQTLHPRYTVDETVRIEEIFPKDSEGWAYFNSTGIFHRSAPRVSDISEGRAEEIQRLLRLKTEELNYNRRKGNLSPDRIDISLTLECHYIKKALKGMDKSPFLPEYSAFVLSYNQIIDHIPLLSFIRSMSREIRSIILKKSASPSSALRKFMYLWRDEPPEEMSYANLGSLILKSPESFKSLILQSRDKITSLATKHFNSNFWNTHLASELTIHGTKIGAFHLMRKIRPEDRALEAAGELLKKGIVPLTGELRGSHNVWNKSKISFSNSSYTWDDLAWRTNKSKALIFSAPSRFSQSVLYATKHSNTHGSHSTYHFNLEETWEGISVSRLKTLLTYSYSELAPIFILKILRVRTTDPSASEKLLPLKELIEQSRAEKGDPTLGHDFYEALTKELAFKLTPEEVKLTEDPMPLIFGVTSRFPDSHDISKGEIRLPSGLNLGRFKDASVVFTAEENLARLEELSLDSDLEVCTIEELFLIESLNMIEGSSIQELHVESLSQATLQATIAKAVQQFAAPHYAKPLPSQPIAPLEKSCSLKIGEQELVPSPFFGHSGKSSYRDYVKSLEDNPDLPARYFHGTLHMLRTTIFSQIFYKILKPEISPKELYLVAMAAAYHDSARQDEGVDRWDELSAWKLRRFLMNHNSIASKDCLTPKVISEEEISECYLALASKDPKGGSFTSNIQKAVHDADCLEIIRCLYTPAAFNSSKLEAKLLIPSFHFEQFLSESIRFISETETQERKAYYEYDSKNPYADLVSYLIDPKNDFPILSTYFLRDTHPGSCGAGAGAGSC